MRDSSDVLRLRDASRHLGFQGKKPCEEGVKMTFSTRPPAYHVEALQPGVALVEVNGPLEDEGIGRWTALLKGVIAEGATGVVVDLRGCPEVDSACHSALIQTSSKMNAATDGGVRLVAYPGSALEDEFAGMGELPVHASVQEAGLYFDLLL
jgi:anti-anti-sigma regulatory factor